MGCAIPPRIDHDSRRKDPVAQLSRARVLRFLPTLAGLALCATALQAQEKVTITDLGPGLGGRILEDALSRPHRLIAPDTTQFTMARGAEEQVSLVVLGRDAAIAGTVDGDVIVVGGDLFIRPGARIS